MVLLLAVYSVGTAETVSIVPTKSVELYRVKPPLAVQVMSSVNVPFADLDVPAAVPHLASMSPAE